MSVNKSRNALLRLGLISEERISTLYPRVRDREDVTVLHDTETGVIFLDRTDHISDKHYEGLDEGVYWGANTYDEALEKCKEDDERRFAQFGEYARNKSVIDIGCGTGGFLDRIKTVSASAAGVEPQKKTREILTSIGHTVYRFPQDAPKKSFDVAFLFHALEHFPEPLETLVVVHKLLKPGGVLIVEVPHARDALLALNQFRNFTFWSEHLILHTQESLKVFLKHTGFHGVTISGYQRYGIANHLGWLATAKPGGQKVYPTLQNETIDEVYKRILIEHGKTDTLIAIARVS